MQVMECAREAVTNGSAGKEEIQIATNGVEVNDDGRIVPALASTPDGPLPINGDGVLHRHNGKRKHEEDEEEAQNGYRPAQPSRL